MKIAVWKTGHEIADRVADNIISGLEKSGIYYNCYWTQELEHLIACSEAYSHSSYAECDVHIGYGILRGMDEVFRSCDEAGKPWFNIDKGYWKPGHYDGYYRVSLRGTQQTIELDKLAPDYARWDALGIEILQPNKRGLIPLVCCPTKHVESFFRSHYRHSWWETQRFNNANLVGHYIDRSKDCGRDLQSDLDKCNKVITFNSSVGWEALRQGIPVISDPHHSIVGAYVKHFEESNKISFATAMQNDSNVRRDLFALMAGLQLTLEEMKDGQLWPLMNRLLSISDMTPARL